MNHSIRNLISAQPTGGYTLPEELTAAAAVVTALSAIAALPVEAPRVDQTAALLVAAATGGKPIDLKAASTALHKEQVAHEVAVLSEQVLRQANEQAESRLEIIASDLADKVIRDHLQPAHAEVLEQAAEQAKALGSASLTTLALMTAPEGVREAYAALAKLAERHRVLRDARNWTNVAGNRKPEQDGTDKYALLRKPRALFPDLAPTAALPREWGIPSEPVEQMLWLVRDAAAAEPWLPTTAEQDAAWDEQYGEAQRMRATSALSARALAGQRV